MFEHTLNMGMLEFTSVDIGMIEHTLVDMGMT